MLDEFYIWCVLFCFWSLVMNMQKKKLHLSLDLNLPHFITIIWKSNTTNLQDFYLLLADLEALEVLFQEAFKGQVSDFLP